MKEYWIRVLGAYMLLKLASALMKDAERLFVEAKQLPTIEVADAEVVVENG